MYNLIKMNLYQLMHSFSTKILLFCTAGLALFCIVATKIDLSDEDLVFSVTENGPEIIDPDQVDLRIGIYTETNPEWVSGKIDYSDLLSAQLQSKILLILVVIFVTLFVSAERKNGFIKNIAGHFPNRGIMVAAKLIAVAVQILLMFAVFALFTLIFSFPLLGNRIELHSAAELLKLAGIQYLLHYAFACLITFLCLLTNSSAMSMTTGILIASGLGTPIYSLIDRAVQWLPKDSFHIAEYMLENNIASISTQSGPKLITSGILTGLAFILITAAFSVLIVQKRDVR